MPRQSVDELCQSYTAAKSARQPHEDDWRKAALHVLPAQYASWQTEGSVANYGQRHKAARRQVFDTTGARSLPKYASVLQRLATPDGQKWHELQASDESLRKKRRVKEYFEVLTGILFRYRYNPLARFKISTSETYMSLGTYGNGPIYIGERAPKTRAQRRGLHYVACPMYNCFAEYDDDGEMMGFYRRMYLSVRQFKAKFPNVPMPKSMQTEAKKPQTDDVQKWEIVHYVRMAGDHDPDALDRRRHPMIGSYFSVKDKEYIGDDTGYASMPYKMPRTMTVSGDGYGYSPAIQALGALGGASAMKKTNLRQGNKAVDPVLLSFDERPVDLRPGAINPNGLDRQGNELVKALGATGNFKVAEVLLTDERNDIEDSFFVTLFQILTETPEMTATEVMERVAEKASLLSPTMGRLQTEKLGPTIEREIDVLTELGVLPEMPPELIEAEGEYDVVYTSPLARSIHAEEVSGFMRSVEMSLNLANSTGDMSYLDHYNFDEAIPEINNIMAVPVRWTSTLEQVQQKRDQRTAQQEQEQVMAHSGGLAAAAKAASELQQ